MAREPSAGQKAAGRLARARRAELGLDQRQLAELAVDVSERTIRSFERGQRWPQAQKLVTIERSLGWRAGHLDDYAARIDEEREDERPPNVVLSTEAMRRILEMDLPPEVQQTMIARLPKGQRDVG